LEFDVVIFAIQKVDVVEPAPEDPSIVKDTFLVHNRPLLLHNLLLFLQKCTLEHVSAGLLLIFLPFTDQYNKQVERQKIWSHKDNKQS
jgi:hypothetical protein